MQQLEIKTIGHLKERYPLQFTAKTFELELTYGWFHVFVQLCVDIDALLATRPDTRFTWTQVKEKFGTARFHCKASNSRTQIDVAKLALAEATKTVEMCICCSEQGALDSHDGYMLTLCKKHSAIRHNDPQVLKIWIEYDDEIVDVAAQLPRLWLVWILPLRP